MSKAKLVSDLIEMGKKNEMQPIKPSPGKPQWPRAAVSSVETRKRDLVVRISNWLKDKDEPAYDVEVYIGGVYDYHESETFALSGGLTKEQAKQKAIEYACNQIRKLL